MSASPFDQPVQFLTGGTRARAELLAKLGINTVGDLLWYLPRDILDLTEVKLPNQLVDGVIQTVAGTIVDREARTTRNNKTLTAVLIDCKQDYVRGTWFNQPWMIHRLHPGDNVLFSGKPKQHAGRWEFSNPRIQWLSEDDDPSAGGGIIPRYPLTDGLRLHDLQRLIRAAVEEFAPQVPEHLPESFLKQVRLPTLSAALNMLHLPPSVADYQLGRKRILYDDLLEFQAGIALRRRAWRARQGARLIEVSAKVDARIRRLFPFQFTPGQNQAIQDLRNDLASGYAMHRLLQADVGAGKTVVAIYAMLAAVAAGFQAVLMAPTELLAQQHWHTVNSALMHSQVQRVLLTGSLGAADRRRALAGINQGQTQLIIGTQAIIQDSVQIPNLAMAVIDEQHKFGVAQRAQFSAVVGNTPPHVLVMTATPIPRSVCLTQFGDLDLSVVKDRPAGRQRVITSRIQGAGSRQRTWNFIRQKLQEGRQLYIVCPQIQHLNHDELTLAAEDYSGAEQVYKELLQTELKGVKLGLVHGQQDRTLRSQTMDTFRDGELQALVSTTVIEVGVDVPNATLMVILQAERFGLSQLHQLRGRVARGKFNGYCFLFSEAATPEAGSRLHAMERTEDGFQIAEADFELRGPGDILGSRQHGALPLKVADLVRDKDLLDEAREAAFLLVRSGEIDTPPFVPFKVKVFERFAELMDLPRSG